MSKNVIEVIIDGQDNASAVIQGAAGGIDALSVAAGGALLELGKFALDGVGKVVSALGDMVGSAMETEVVLTRIQGVITSTGGAAGMTIADVQALGNQFANLAGGSDDAVLAIQDMALRMGNISKAEMPDFIQTVLDMAAATGIDAVTAARNLALAQDQPTAAIAKLQKQGILFTDALKKEIAALEKSGDTAGAFALVMQRVGEATEGQAAAKAETFTGKLEALKGRIGEAGEAIGMALLPALSELFDGIIAPAIPLVEGLAASFADAVSVLDSSYTPMEAIATVLGNVLMALGGVSPAFNAAGQEVIAFGDDLNAMAAGAAGALQPIVDGAMKLYDAFVANLPAMQEMFTTMWASITTAWETYGPPLVTNISTALTTLAQFWTDHGAQIMGIVSFAFNIIVQTIGGALLLATTLINVALNTINGIFDFFTLALTGDWDAAFKSLLVTAVQNFQMIVDFCTTFVNGILTSIGTNMQQVIAGWTAAWDLAVIIVRQVWTNIQDAVAAAIMDMTGGIQAFVIDVGRKIMGIIDAVAAFPGQIKALFDTAVGNIKAAFSLDWGAIGRSVIDGIIGGVTNAAGNLAASAANAAKNALQAAKDALGISSPSKAFAEVGANMMAGMAQGISGNSGQVQSAVSNVSNRTLHYEPHYETAPAQPLQDLEVMGVMYG